MAIKAPHPRKLSFTEIVMGANAEVIRTAYEARVKIDGLLAEREAAYHQILELENQIEAVIGEDGVFVYPPPPAPVAGIPKLEPAARRTEPPPTPAHPVMPPGGEKTVPAPKKATAEKSAAEKSKPGDATEPA